MFITAKQTNDETMPKNVLDSEFNIFFLADIIRKIVQIKNLLTYECIYIMFSKVNKTFFYSC